MIKNVIVQNWKTISDSEREGVCVCKRESYFLGSDPFLEGVVYRYSCSSLVFFTTSPAADTSCPPAVALNSCGGIKTRRELYMLCVI